jgi:tetratricopeptide (TPR) repeat protein
VYVVDFGIAKAVMDNGAERLTGTGVSIGTAAYMSPEQASGEPVDARTDQYSLATVLYEMLAGDPPFSGSTAHAVLARRLTEAARPIRTVRANVPEPVERAVLRALERVPGDRYPDVAGFVEGLRDRRTAPARRRSVLIGLAGLAVVAAAALALLLAPRPRDARPVRDSLAVALYQRGMEALAKRTEEGAADALTSFKAALERDSTYGAAWAGLAQTYYQTYGRRFLFSGAAGDSVIRLALAAKDRAAALDGRNPEVLYTQAVISRIVDPTDAGPMLKALREAVAADSGTPRYWHTLGVVLYDVGRRDEAIAAWRRGIATNPAYVETLSFLALGFMWARRYDSAATWADSAIAVDPSFPLARQARGNVEVERGNFARAAADFEAVRRLSSGVEVPNALAGIALVAARAGRKSEARRLMGEVESLMAPYTPVPLHNAVYNAAAYAAVGNPARAIEWLARFTPRASLHFQLHLRCDPPLDPLADDPRFKALLLTPRPGAAGC